MAYPINQVFLGGDPILDGVDDIDSQIRRMEAYRNRLRQSQNIQPKRLVWDDIDAEVSPMTDEQKSRLLQDEEYSSVYNELQAMVQSELLNLVKGRIESSDRGKSLLDRQLGIIRRLKAKIVSDTSREMEMFNRFREYSKAHPEATYDDFVRNGL